MFHIVLLEPEIPQNTGNIGRTCVASGSSLHLIEPMGFRITEKQVRRAGLDYWDRLNLTIHDSYRDFISDFQEKAKSCQERKPRIWMATTKARRTYSEVEYHPGDYIMFGKESAGIPEEILVEHEEDCIRIPMIGDIRSLNLGNSVAIVLYEALRQNHFTDMNQKGELHRLHW